VPLDSQCDDGSGGSDDYARNDQLKLNIVFKPGGPVDGHVDVLSDQKRPVGGEAQTAAAHVDSATGTGFNCPMEARDAVPNLQAHWKADAGAAV
jgi:hypothetical protein